MVSGLFKMLLEYSRCHGIASLCGYILLLETPRLTMSRTLTLMNRAYRQNEAIPTGKRKGLGVKIDDFVKTGKQTPEPTLDVVWMSVLAGVKGALPPRKYGHSSKSLRDHLSTYLSGKRTTMKLMKDGGTRACSLVYGRRVG
jgi:hypothetical protein